VRELFRNPRHPYTRGLLASIPGGAPGSKLQAIQGTVPPLGDLPPGCAFAPRCPNRFEPCDVAPPGVTVILPAGLDPPPDVDLPPKGGSYGVSVRSAGGASGASGASGPESASGAHSASGAGGGSSASGVSGPDRTSGSRGASGAGGVSGPGSASGPDRASGSSSASDPGSFRLQAEGQEAAPDAHAHTTRCYLYSPAVDPQVLPEVKR
jgi:oligopeptide/dipeptide ABC transporter ATP-binding protein